MENMGFLNGIRRNGKYGIFEWKNKKWKLWDFLHGIRRNGKYGIFAWNKKKWKIWDFCME